MYVFTVSYADVRISFDRMCVYVVQDEKKSCRGKVVNIYVFIWPGVAGA